MTELVHRVTGEEKPQKMLILVALFCLAALAEAEVNFKYSAIYDEYDLNNNKVQAGKEIPLKSCSVGGCSVYVSVPKWNVDSTANLYVYSKTAGTNTSLYSFSADIDVLTWAKTGLHLAYTDYSIMNYNTKNVGPIVIYVVGSQAKFYDDKEVEIYDAVNINMRPAKNKKMTMIMSAEPFNIYVQAFGNNLNAFVRTTGFDNNYQKQSDDNCRIIYEQNEGRPFRLRINSPIVTINFDGIFNYQICAKIDDNNAAALDYSGVATSYGYIGCAENNFQTYRSTVKASDEFTLTDDHEADRETDLTYVANTNNLDKVSFSAYYNSNNGGFDLFDIQGDGMLPTTKREKAYKIFIKMPVDQGSSYWVGYTPVTGGISIPSGQGICTDFTQTTTSTSSEGTSRTVSFEVTTTSANGLSTALFTCAIVFFAACNL